MESRINHKNSYVGFSSRLISLSESHEFFDKFRKFFLEWMVLPKVFKKMAAAGD